MRSTCSGLSADNYDISYEDGSLTVHKAKLAVNAVDKSKQVGDPDPPLTYTLSGFKNSENATSAGVTGAGSCSLDPSAGPNVGVYTDAITCLPGTLAADNYTFVAGSKGKLTITQAATTLAYQGDSSAQYSDKAKLKALLKSGATPLSGKTVNFRIGAQEKQATTDSNGVAETTLKIDQAPGNPGVGARFAGDTNYAQSATGPSAFEVKKEDARAVYTGLLFTSTSSPTSSSATVTLSATIRDITDVIGDGAYDADAGDIRKATVDFVNRDTNTTLCSNLPVGLVSAADTKVGTATCNWSANIGSADSASYTIGIKVNNYYTRNESADNVVVTVSKPLASSFITGGGYLVNQQSAGLYAGEAAKRTNFGFNVKYNKSGTNLQGAINAIVRKGAGVYQVKGTAMSSLTSAVSGNPKTSTFTGKANIQNITNPAAAEPIDGNATLQVTMSDYGEPGSSDKIAITVWNKAGGLWFASRWDGTKTLEQLLAGGNLVVR